MHITKKRHITLKILLFLIGIDLVETFAQFCFKKSSLSLGDIQIQSFGDIPHFIASVLSTPFFWFGLIAVILIFISWSTALSKIDLSVAVPVCSFSYITVPLVSVFFFKEQISLLRWSGIFIILCGVILVSASSREKGSTQ
ncbi:MAG: EamA family transporter [Candidatus Omnitrophica bacterium]|nr:EamA family transporter [Candidatus Omnitrophota bacterium]